MPKTLADGKIKLSIMAVKPADPNAPTLAELNAGIDAACRVVNSGFKMGPAASDTVDEKPLCTPGNSKIFTVSNYEAQMTVFRFFDLATGQAEVAGTSDPIGDGVYQACKKKGSTLYFAKRFTSKASTDPWAAGDEVEVYEVMTDNAVDAEATGFIKKELQLSVLDAWLDGKVAAGA